MEASQKDFDFAEVLTRMAHEKASDVHLSPGFPPAIRIRGKIVPLEEYGKLSPQHTRDTVYSLLNDDQRKRFESNKQLDLAYAVPGVARFRVNCFFQRGVDQRRLPPHPARDPEARGAGAPAVLEDFTRSRAASCSSPARPARASRPRWRRCSTSSTRGARSTSSRSRTRSSSSTTHKGCIVNQREIGADADDFCPRAEVGSARGPRRDPRRRDARPRDDVHRPDRGRDGPPGLRHAPHPVHRPDRGPDHRRLPLRAAEAGADAALDRAAGDRHPAAAADRRRLGPGLSPARC